MSKILDVNDVNAPYRGQNVKVKGLIQMINANNRFISVDCSIYNKETFLLMKI